MRDPVLRLALPSIVSNITVPLLGIVDTAISGHMGSPAVVGAIAVGGMLFNTMFWLFAFLRMSTSGQTAQALGRGDYESILNYLRNGLLKAFVYGAIILIMSPIILRISFYLIAPEIEIELLSSTYFYIRIWGLPAVLAMFVLAGWYVGMGNTRIPMYVAIGQNIVNILISLFLVYFLGMGISGIALGTAISDWLGFTLSFVCYRQVLQDGVTTCCYDTVEGGVCVNDCDCPISGVSLPLFLRTLCMIVVHFLFVSAGSRQGAVTLAANTVIIYSFVVFSYFMDGLANAGEALVGRAIGARDSRMYDSVVRSLFVWGVGIALLFTALYYVGSGWFLSMLTDSEPVLAVMSDYKLWVVSVPLVSMAAFIWDGIYIGALRARYMLLSTALGMAVFLGGCYIFIPIMGNHGLWLSFVLYLAMRGLVLTFFRHTIVLIGHC